MLYLINGVILILSLLYFFNLYGYYNIDPLIWINILSAIVTFIAAVSAKPPIRREQTSKISMKNIENIVYNYLKENKGSTLTVSALGVRLENSVKTYNERKYIRENLRMILNNLITSGKIDSTLHHEELHYFVADVDQKKAEELEPIPSIPEKIEEKPIKTCPHCGQKIPLESKFCNNCGVKLEEIQPTPPISEKEEEKPITEILQIKLEEMQPTLPISEKEEEKPITEVPQIKAEEVQTTSPISKVEKVITEVPQIKTEEMQRTPPISKKEEKEPVSEVSHIKEEKEEVPKEFSYTCRFCGMKLTEKVNICPQCGTIIKP
jgi:DNA-directed RNA polymerase subunit RPC12/RpoP